MMVRERNEKRVKIRKRARWGVKSKKDSEKKSGKGVEADREG